MAKWYPFPYLESAGCPHCQGGRARSCCVCGDVGRLFQMWALIDACKNTWARPGCPCLACRAVGPGPVVSINIDTPRHGLTR